MTGRVFKIVQNERNEKTGEILMTDSQIQRGLNHDTIKQWAYCWHDKDEGKAKHAHVAISCPGKADVAMVARWFNVPEGCVSVPKGRGAFMDCVEYLTHESEEQQAQGKYRYPDSEVHANFDFRAKLDERNKAIREEKEREENEVELYGKKLTPKERVRNQVLYEGLTIEKLCRTDPLAYQKDFEVLDKLRAKYLKDFAPIPETRINFYVFGGGGEGKTMLCKALARALCPEIETPQETYFTVGSKNVTFENYDGQPVIIWNDKRAIDFLLALGGRDNVFDVLDPHPDSGTRNKQHIKYGYTCLTNRFNIINGIQPYREFLDGLAGEYTDRSGNVQRAEDLNQSRRRIPIIIPVHENGYDILINCGVFNNTREYDQYFVRQNVRGSIKKIAQICGSTQQHKALRKDLETEFVKPIAQAGLMLQDKMLGDTTKTDEELREEYRRFCTEGEKAPEPDEPPF